jgi:Fic family protein
MNMPNILYPQYRKNFYPIVLPSLTEIQADNSFGYKNNDVIAAIYSSNIEGNSIDINTYFNWSKSSKKSKEKEEIDNLALAYEFAKNNTLTIDNILKAHKILSKSFLESFQRGKYKTQQNGVFSDKGIVYLACEVSQTAEAMKDLFDEIQCELDKDKSVEAVFFLASVVHLKLAHIHPFADGNGRVCRLVEKWLLSQNIGPIAFYIPTELYYKTHRAQYYSNINLGQTYLDLDYSNALPFLSMLPQSLLVNL